MNFCALALPPFPLRDPQIQTRNLTNFGTKLPRPLAAPGLRNPMFCLPRISTLFSLSTISISSLGSSTFTISTLVLSEGFWADSQSARSAGSNLRDLVHVEGPEASLLMQAGQYHLRCRDLCTYMNGTYVTDYDITTLRKHGKSQGLLASRRVRP